MPIAINSLRIDGGTQTRAQLNEAVVAEYAEVIRFGCALPPVTVYFDGSAYWLADGFHRYHAHRTAGAMEIDADVRNGTKRDAVLHSVGANASHGLRRTNEDKRRAVETLLADAEWSEWSNNAIAKACGVSHTFVAAIRSPEAAEKQQDNRDKNAAKRVQAVESDSTLPVESDSTDLRVESGSTLKVEPGPTQTAAPTDDDLEDQPDLAVELQAADKEIRRLNQLVETLSAGSDLAQQVAEWSLKFDQLSGRNAQLMRTSNEAQSQARYQGDLLTKIRKTLGVTTNAEILPAISARRVA